MPEWFSRCRRRRLSLSLFSLPSSPPPPPPHSTVCVCLCGRQSADKESLRGSRLRCGNEVSQWVDRAAISFRFCFCFLLLAVVVVSRARRRASFLFLVAALLCALVLPSLGCDCGDDRFFLRIWSEAPPPDGLLYGWTRNPPLAESLF